MKRLLSALGAVMLALSFSLAAFAASPVQISTTVPAAHTVTVNATHARVLYAGKSSNTFSVERQSSPSFQVLADDDWDVSSVIAVGTDGTTEDLTAALNHNTVQLAPVYQEVVLTVTTVYAPRPAPAPTPAPTPKPSAAPQASPAPTAGTNTPAPTAPAAALPQLELAPGDSSVFAPPKTTVVVPGTEILPAQQTDRLLEIAASVREAENGSVLQSIAAEQVKTVATREAVDAAREQLAEKIGAAAETLAVSVVTETHWQVEPVAADAENHTLTLNITPTCIVKATTDTENMTEENTVLLQEETPLRIAQRIDITVDIPEDFAAEGDTVYVTHIHEGKTYFYSGAVVRGEAGLTMTFTNPNGFSEFRFSLTDPRAEAQKPRSAWALPLAVGCAAAVVAAAALVLVRKKKNSREQPR